MFPAKGVAYLGDLFPSKAAPFIDTRNGGSGVAYPETLAKAVAEITGVVRVITGHGTPIRGTETLPDTVTTVGRRPPHEVMRWTDLQEYAEFNRDFLAAVQAAKQAGKTVDEAVADLQLPEKYTAYGMEHAKANVQAIYGRAEELAPLFWMPAAVLPCASRTGASQTPPERAERDPSKGRKRARVHGVFRPPL